MKLLRTGLQEIETVSELEKYISENELLNIYGKALIKY